MGDAAGDKVRLKAGDNAGARGIVKAVEGDQFVVRLDDSGVEVRVAAAAVTNYSLAARKAWVTGPDRAVGRRKGTKLTDRISVTLRIDRGSWELFLALEEAMVIEDRTRIINDWFREKLAGLKREQDRCPKR